MLIQVNHKVGFKKVRLFLYHNIITLFFCFSLLFAFETKAQKPPHMKLILKVEDARFAGDFMREQQLLDSGVSVFPEKAGVIWRYARMLTEHGTKNSSLTKREKKDTLMLAINYAKRAVELDNNNPDSYYMLSIAYAAYIKDASFKEMVGYSDDIKENIEKAIELDPKHHRAMHALGRWYFQVSDLGVVLIGLAEFFYGQIPTASFELAAEQFEKAYAIKALPIHLLWWGKSLLKDSKKDSAKIVLQKLLNSPTVEYGDEAYIREAKSLLDKLN